jgi:ketosteroid isomerase-like protein
MPLDAHDLIRAETALQHAVVAADLDAVDALLHDDVRFTGADGRVIGKAEDLETIRSGVLVVSSYEPVAQQVLVVGDAGLSLVEAKLAGTVRGESFAAHLRYTRTWVRDRGAWRVIAAHASAVGSSPTGG